MDHPVEEQTQRINENVAFFAVDPLACIITMGVDASPAFFCAPHALAINDGDDWTRLALAALAAFDIERMMHSIQRAVEAPQIQVIEKGAAWRKILGNRPPLASRVHNRHDPIHDLTDVDPALVASRCWRAGSMVRLSPFLVGQVTRISQFAAVVTPAVLRRPHRCPFPESNHNPGNHK